MDGRDVFVVARYLDLWHRDTMEGRDGIGRVPVVTHHQLSRSGRPKQHAPYFTAVPGSDLGGRALPHKVR